MGVEDDDEEASETDYHVNDGEDTVDAGGGVEVREVIDGGDEGVPWKEEATAEGEVDDVGEVEGVFGDLRRCDGEEVSGFGVAVGGGGETHLGIVGGGG